MKSFSKKSPFLYGLLFTIIAATALSSYATIVKIKSTINIRKQNKNGVLEVIATLPKGTVVRIPAKYKPQNHQSLANDTQDEATIVNWLKHSSVSSLLNFSSKDKIKREYFAEVEVLKIPKGNKKLQGKIGYIALANLFKRKKLELVTDQESAFYEINSLTSQANPLTEQTNSLTEQIKELNEITEFTNEACESYRFISQILAPEINRINDTPAIKRLESVAQNQRIIDSLIRRVGPGFIKTIKEEAANNNIPPELLLSIMHVESAGDCGAKAPGNENSFGLFQVNLRSSSRDMRICNLSKELIQRSKTSCANEENFSKLPPYCLQNPQTNLEEAIKILKNKYSDVTRESRIEKLLLKYSDVTQDKLKKLESIEKWLANWPEEDKWRLATAAYNGGQTHVVRALYDLQLYNSIFPNNKVESSWKGVRLFFIKTSIEGTPHLNEFSESRTHNRSKDYSIHNLSYAESIWGQTNTDNSFNQLWKTKLAQL